MALKNISRRLLSLGISYFPRTFGYDTKSVPNEQYNNEEDDDDGGMS